jgi:hypothetical protein
MSDSEPVAGSKLEQLLPKYSEQVPVYESDITLSRRAMGALLGAGALSFGSGWPAQADGTDVKETDPPDSYGIGTGGFDLELVTFDGTPSSTHTWSASPGGYDPLATKTDLTFKGTLKDKQVGILKTTDKKAWPDVSSCEGISLSVKTSEPYNGLYITFGKGYKAQINIKESEPASPDGYRDVQIPFTLFSDSAGVRPLEGDEENLGSMSFSAEGAPGKFGLSIKSVLGYSCKKVGQIPKDQLAVVEETGTISSWLLAAVSAVLVAFVAVRMRSRPAPIASPLLG